MASWIIYFYFVVNRVRNYGKLDYLLLLCCEQGKKLRQVGLFTFTL